jgi:O-succinylhomoserine sulfhydrylase
VGAGTAFIEDDGSRFRYSPYVSQGLDMFEGRLGLVGGAKAVFCESPSNPTLELVDIQAVAVLAHAAGARLIVDNVFATPLAQRPLELGADIVVYSTTKHIDGQGRSLGGAILGSGDFMSKELSPFLRHTGPALSPFNAWLLLKGLETLDLRVAQHARNAADLAAFLEAHPKGAAISYPASLIVFSVAVGQDATFRFLDALEIVVISNTLGDAKSLICHPATTTHQSLPAAERTVLGIGPSLLRFSVGLEDVDDLREDLDRALGAS